MESRPFETESSRNLADRRSPDAGDPVMTRICQFLEKGKFASCEPLYRGSNQVFLVVLSREGQTLGAVYKPRQGEAPLWDFPEGTLYKREYAAYLVSKALGWHLVPPTVVRSGPCGIGSLQWFVDAKPALDYYGALPDKRLPELKRIAVFDCLVNNADRKAGHCLEGKDGRLWLIDHGLTFNIVPKLRTVLWEFSGQPIPKELVADLNELQQDLKRKAALREALSRLLEAEEIDTLERRLRKIIDSPVFPYPESRRSMPWPPF